LTFARQGRVLVVGAFSTRLWDVASGAPLGELTRGDQVVGLDVSTDGELVASAAWRSGVQLWRPARLPADGFHGHVNWVTGLAIDPRSELVYSGGHDGTIRVWNIATGRERAPLAQTSDFFYSLDISSDGLILAGGGRTGLVQLWDTVTHEHRSLPMGGKTIWGVAFGPRGRRLATAGNDGRIRLWDVASGTLERVVGNHPSRVWGLAYGNEGRRLASAGEDGTARVWRLDSAAAPQVLEVDGVPLRGVAIGPQGRQVATGDMAKRVRLFDLDAGSNRLIGTHPGTIRWSSFHPDRRHLGSPSSDGSARIWDLEAGGFVELRGHTPHTDVNWLRFTPDGKFAVTTGDDSTVRVWHADTGEPFWWAPIMLRSPVRLLSHRGWARLDVDSGDQRWSSEPALWRQALERRARVAAESPDRQLLCLLTHDERLEIWDCKADQRRLDTPLSGARQVVATPEGCAVLTADGTASFHRLSGSSSSLSTKATALARNRDELLVAAAERVLVHTLAGQQRRALYAPPSITALLPVDGQRRLVVGLAGGSIEIWPRSERPTERLATLHDCPRSGAIRLILGPKGIIVAGTQNGTLGLWNMDDGSLLETRKLHGPVVHLLATADKVYAASELGDVQVVDLEVYVRDYCELLREAWRDIPVVWSAGRALRLGRPKTHTCYRKPRQ